MKEIKVTEFNLNPIDIWHKKWFLLTVGNMTRHNTMTVAWGSIGTMWNKPFAQVVVRPTRFTYEFLEKHQCFSLCSFPEKYRPALNLLGTKSGRDLDKIKESGLTVIPSSSIESPSFKEADLTLECKKVYWQDMDNSHFLAQETENLYPEKNYHRIYFGHILKIFTDS